MTRAINTMATAGLLLWWSPTLAAAVALAVPHVAAALGTGYRVRRVRRLIARGDLDEAERVADALHRERAAAVCWRETVTPHRRRS